MEFRMNSIILQVILQIIPGLLLLIFFFVIIFLKEHTDDKELHQILEIFFLTMVYLMYLILFPKLGSLALYVFSLGLLLTGSFKSIRTGVILCLASGLFGFLVACIGHPIFIQIEEREVSFFKFLLFPIKIPFFYYIIPLEAISSSLFSWLFTTYTWETLNMIRRKSLTQKRARNEFEFYLKSAVRYLQLTPVGLLPLMVPHIVSDYTLLYQMSYFLGSLCLSKIYFIAFSFLIVFARKRVFENPFLRVTSVFTLLSLVSIFFSLFEYIAFNIPLGVLIISLCLSSLLGASLGFSIAGSIINDTSN